MSDYDVAVVGGGPVGSYTALSLAKAGCRVIVFEASDSTDQNVCCTGIVSSDCYNQFIAPFKIPCRAVRSAIAFSPHGQSLHLQRPETQAYIIDRPALNRALYQQCRLIGVDYHLNSRVVHIETSQGASVLKTQHTSGYRTTVARITVLACGLASAMPRRVGLGRIKQCAVGAQVNVTTNVEEVEIYFDQEMAPGGFAWLVPTWQGKGLAGIVSHRNAARYLWRFIQRLQDSGKIHHWSELRQKAIPVGTIEKTYGAHVIAVGEAAGQVKPTTFGGIYTGMLCATLAVRTIREALAAHNFSERKLAEYDRAWKAVLQARLRQGYILRQYYNSLNNQRIERLFHLARAYRLHEKLLTRQDFSFDWHTAPLLRLVCQPEIIKSLLKSEIRYLPKSLFTLMRLISHNPINGHEQP